jgi:UDP-N-acetylmuramoyl-L-alanyl-D-glutamate--2,6-diaminopimelate ligase
VRLGDLLAELPEYALSGGDARAEVRSIELDSRRVKPGAIFVAMLGAHVDGHSFVSDAFARGAVAAVVDRKHVATVEGAPALIVVDDTQVALSQVSAILYGHPSRALIVVGVTGTNGKTTVTQMVAAILNAAGLPCGVIGTVDAHFGEKRWSIENTTPLAHELHALLRKMRDAGARAVAMEVSSHGLALDRVRDVHFTVGAFTNLTRDHLDFHGTTAAYADAKHKLFTMAKRCAFNIGDAYGARWAREIASRKPTLTYALEGPADLVPGELTMRADGSDFTVGNTRFHVHLPGRFNVANALCAIACARLLDVDDAAAATGLASVTRVPGRMERIAGGDINVIVDYSHTPDSLENALAALRETTSGGLAVVFGCGGDRDRGKRPQMGEIAARLADRVYVTSDNPRMEDPRAILNDIVGGMGDRERVVEPDRRAAIVRAVREAESGDTVLVAGKGHEAYQIIGEKTLPFDDAAVAREALALRGTQ